MEICINKSIFVIEFILEMNEILNFKGQCAIGEGVIYQNDSMVKRLKTQKTSNSE